MPVPAEKAAATSTSPKTSPTKEVSSTSPKSSPSKKEEAKEQALDHFAQGKRHLIVNDIKAAVNSLQEACRLLAEQHGETSPECGDAYFYYGRALLEMARMESDVLGNALDGVPEGDDLDNSQVENPDKLTDEEREKLSEQVGEALEENFKTCEKADSKDTKADAEDTKADAEDTKADDSKDDKVEDKSDEPMEDGKSKDEAESSTKDKDSAMDTDSENKEEDTESQDDDSQDDSQEEGEEDQDGEEEKEDEGEKTEEEKKKEEEDEDVSNHQLAWEMLELAKVIYQRQEEGNKAMSLKTAQVFLKLGEVGLESENYPQSIEDFQSCLKIQETHMEADDRCLAETHYQLGVAHSFSDEFDNSIESFTKALKIMEVRIVNLEKRKTEKEGWTEEQKKKDAESSEDASYTEDSEIKELNNLLPEIKEKIVDMEEMKKDSKDKINKVKKELGMASAIGGPSTKEIEGTSNSFGSSSSTSSEAKAIDTSMIRKKRKPEDEVEDAAKKTKADNGEAKDSDKETKSDSKDLKKKAVEVMEAKTKELKA